MKARIKILFSMIAFGAAFGAFVGVISSALVSFLLLLPDIAGATFGVLLGSVAGMLGGGQIGAIIGFVAGIITNIFASQTRLTTFYRICMATVCTSLTIVLVFTLASEWIVDFEQFLGQGFIWAMTLVGALSALIISLIFANFYREFTHWKHETLPPSA